MLRAGVLGSPIAHSLSPVMHRAAYAHLGLSDWTYDRRECEAAELPALVAGLDESWRGLSLTMPLKEAALALATTVDPVAESVGGANTLVRRPDLGWDAYNTDVHGVRQALADHRVTSARHVLVLGSGATARSALAAVRELGARTVAFGIRSEVRPETGDLLDELGVAWSAHPLDEVNALVRDADLVIDTLPGRGADAVAAQLADVPRLPALFEAIYEDWPTTLARTFAATGAPVVSGLEMLAHQGALQVEHMTGRPVPASVLLDAASGAWTGR